MRKRFLLCLLILLSVGHGFAQSQGSSSQKIELLLSAAASLTDCMNELKTIYMTKNPSIFISCNYGSSGALQQQIEQGAPVDLFFSAGVKQMKALVDKGIMDASTVRNVLENHVVLIVPKDRPRLSSFDELRKPSVTKIGIGDPKSVPAGQYAEQVFKNLDLSTAITGKLVLAKDVREVLFWVETGNVDAGVVYATDARVSDKVVIAAIAPEDSHEKIVYPVGVVKDSAHPKEAKAFEDFLCSDDAGKVFAKYGFAVL